MKTRAEIYGNEAADLLRTVTMYPGLSEQQLLCFHPGKEDTAKALLSHLERQGRIFQAESGGYFPAGQPQNLTGRLSGQCGSCWTSFSGPNTMLPLIFLSSSFSLPMANSTKWPALRTGRRHLSAMPCGAIRAAAAALFWSIHRRRSPKSTAPAFPGSVP